MRQCIIENYRRDPRRDPVGVRFPGAGQAIEQPLRLIGLKIAPDLIELLAAVADLRLTG